MPDTPGVREGASPLICRLRWALEEIAAPIRWWVTNVRPGSRVSGTWLVCSIASARPTDSGVTASRRTCSTRNGRVAGGPITGRRRDRWPRRVLLARVDRRW